MNHARPRLSEDGDRIYTPHKVIRRTADHLIDHIAEVNEAQQRLSRLANILFLRFAAAGPDQWDRPRGENQTLRQIAEHVGTAWYAEQIGDLSPPRETPR